MPAQTNTDRLVKLLADAARADQAARPRSPTTRRWRCGGGAVGSTPGAKGARRPISTMTVNDTIEQLKKLFTYVKSTGVSLPKEPKWKDLWLEERAPTSARAVARRGRGVGDGDRGHARRLSDVIRVRPHQW